MIPLFIWGLSNHPVKDFKFSFLMLKFKKYRVCRFAPRRVRVLDKFPHGEELSSKHYNFFDIEMKSKF
jgi:hypothetical protein